MIEKERMGNIIKEEEGNNYIEYAEQPNNNEFCKKYSIQKEKEDKLHKYNYFFDDEDNKFVICFLLFICFLKKQDYVFFKFWDSK